MPSANVLRIIERVLEHEGGIADVGDGQGLTRFGQTPAWLERWGYLPPVGPAEAMANYADWMRKLSLDAVADLDVEVGFLVTDWAVHAGHHAAIKGLQRALGVVTDGLIGPKTLAALEDAPRRPLTRQVLAYRLREMGTILASSQPDRRKFARGWLNRMADQIERLP